MRIYCLTSIKLIPQIDGIQRSIVEDPESFKDEYTIRTMNLNEMKKAEAYALTEIDIGYDFIYYTNYPVSINREQQIKVYWLSIYRDDINIIMIPMLRGNVKIDPVQGEKHVYDLTVAFAHIKFTSEKFDMILRIRCIKNTIIKGISRNEENEYKQYAEKIEAHPEGREMAFKCIPFSLPHETKDSAMRTKMSDFKTLINLLCDPKTGKVENVPSGKRYNQRSKCILSDRKYWVHKSQKNPRKETIKNEAKQFRDCKKIDLTSANLADLDLTTLESDNLERLWLNDIDLSVDIEILKSYAKNINFSKLIDIDFNSCKTQPLPKEIAEQLPPSLENIIFHNCNISSIPESISRLINLEQLYLDENEGLEENGIPWEHLPPSLTSLSFEDKSITVVPSSINRLINLKTFNVVSENLKTVAWKDIPDSIDWLRVESKTELNPIDLSGKEDIEYLSISCPHLKEIISFPLTTKLYLDYCGLKSFNCENSLQNLVDLSIVENGLIDIAWEHLPVTLENLNLDKNKLRKIENIGHLVNLKELRVDENEITYISIEITLLQNLKLLYICNNHLTELPEGFENLQHLFDLRLSKNDFNYDENAPGDLNEKLWKRLPLRLGQLVLNSNNLFKIPCTFRFTRLQNLHIKGCNLSHICPRVYLQAQRLKTFSKTYCLSMDIRKNENLKYLSFIPSIIYQPPLATEEKQNHDIINTFWLTSMEVASDNEKLRNTAKFQTSDFKPKYDFKISSMDGFCDCCGICGKAAKNVPLKKQNMVMDFMIVFIKAEEEDPFSKPKLEPGKWKSEIHTKMCPSCQEAFFEKTEQAYKKSINAKDEIENEIIEKRQKLPNENSPFGLQTLQIQDLQCLKLKNYDVVDCFLIAAVNAIDAMDDLKISIFKNPNNNETQKELIKIFKQKVKSVRSLRETLPTFATNEQEDAGSALCKLIESLDETSKSLVLFGYDTVERCLCETPKFQNVPNCITVHLTVGKVPNQSITFNSMLANWTRFNSNLCSICGSEKIIDRNVQLGDCQQYLIVELHTMTNNPNGTLVPCSIPFTNFNANSQLIFGALWELKCAIQYIGNGKTGHYVTWKKNKSGWTVINDDDAKHEKQLLQDLKNYKILIFKKLVVQLLVNNDETMEVNDANMDAGAVGNEDVYMPNQYVLQNHVQQDDRTILYTSPQSTLPPINTFVDQQIQYQPQQDVNLQYQYQPQYQQPLQSFPPNQESNQHVFVSYSTTNTNQPNINNSSHDYSTPVYQTRTSDQLYNDTIPHQHSTPIYQSPQHSYQQPLHQSLQQRLHQQFHQPIQQPFHQPLHQPFHQPVQQPVHQPVHQPLSPISSLINMSLDEHGNYVPINNNAVINVNPPSGQEQDYYYYPQEDDWSWKQNL